MLHQPFPSPNTHALEHGHPTSCLLSGPAWPGHNSQAPDSARRHGDVLVVLHERALLQLADHAEGPPRALRGQLERERHVDDDLLVARLGLRAQGPHASRSDACFGLLACASCCMRITTHAMHQAEHVMYHVLATCLLAPNTARSAARPAAVHARASETPDGGMETKWNAKQ